MIPPPGTALRTFAFSDASSHKFWNIELKGTAFTVTYGRQGTPGTKQEKTFADAAAAQKEHDKLVAEKVKKGYKETTPKQSAPASLREALEAALVEKPDDLASHMAYADYLGEQDDPRGEFIRLQLLLENPNLAPAERKKLAAQEKKLLEKHEREWLGPLAEWLLDPKPHPRYEWRNLKCEWSWRRGWLDALKVDNHSVRFCRALAKAPAARLLRRLHLAEQDYEEAGDYEPGPDVPATETGGRLSLYPLIGAGVLGNVRELIVGEVEQEGEGHDGYFNCHTSGEQVVGVVKGMPRLEVLHAYAHRVDGDQLFSLRTLPELRELVVYHSYSYPIGRLAKNDRFPRLEVIRFHPHALEYDETAYIKQAAVRDLVRSPHLPALRHLQLRLSDITDKGVKDIVESGILRRLKVLDLQHAKIGDKGADLFAASPDARNLDVLELSHNRLSPAAVARLQAAGVKVRAVDQRSSGDEDEEYLYHGDCE